LLAVGEEEPAFVLSEEQTQGRLFAADACEDGKEKRED
jgi:hypothetical protein